MKNTMVHADCLDFLPTIPNHSIDLAILDPPYNVRADTWDRVDNYLQWMKQVIGVVFSKLKDNASLYLWGMSKNNDFLRLKLWIDEYNKLIFRNWIVWVHECKIHQKPTQNFIVKHEDLLFYSTPKATFNILRDEPPPFQLKMHAGKYNQNYYIKKDDLFPSQQKIFKHGLQLGSPAKSWWKGPSNQSAAKKYPKFMGYKSEWVCQRIILASSNTHDNVLIPFAGHGTECVVCQKLERNYFACEIDQAHFEIAQERIGSER